MPEIFLGLLSGLYACLEMGVHAPEYRTLASSVFTIHQQAVPIDIKGEFLFEEFEIPDFNHAESPHMFRGEVLNDWNVNRF